MPGVESGPTPQGAVNWKAPRSPEIKSPAREMVRGALQAIAAEHAGTDLGGRRQTIDIALETRLLPDLSARMEDPNFAGDPEFRTLVEQIIAKLGRLPDRTRAQETLLVGLSKMREQFETDEAV